MASRPRHGRWTIVRWSIVAVAVLVTSAACSRSQPGSESGATLPTPSSTSSAPPGSGIPRYEGSYLPQVQAVHPHDTGSFTQGLEWYDGLLLESTGLEGESSLRLVDPLTGQPDQLLDLDDDLFAEGVTAVDGRAIQLTWQDEALLITDLPELAAATSSRLDRAYQGEGWGLCYDGTRLVMSDGSDRLTFRDPDSFESQGQVAVTLDGQPLARLNELECVGDQVWANVWQTTTIVAIDPRTGAVEATVDGSGLVPEGYAGDTAAVLNGIAFDHLTGMFWLTGKLWPVIYQVELTAESSTSR